MNPGGSVPLRVAAVGVILGLVVGGAVVGALTLQLGRAGATVTETRTAVQTVSTVTSTVRAEPPNVVATTTITTGAPRGPTMDIQATQLLYYGGSSITLFGTIYPPPSAEEGVVVATKDPKNLVVNVGQAQISSSTGSFSFVIGASGTQNWIQGAYNVTATSGGKTVSTTFWFSPAQPSKPAQSLVLNVLAPPLVKAGEQVSVAVLATVPSGAPDEVTTWNSLSVLYPDGTFHQLCQPTNSSANCTGIFAKIQTGFYQISFTLPGNALQGTYFIEASVGDSSGGSALALGQFVVQ